METILEPEARADSDDSGGGTHPPGFLMSVADAAEALSALCRGSVQAGGLMSIGQTAKFAADVEAMARSVDYLQIVCAGALDTHRVAEAFGSSGSACSADGPDEPGACAEGAAGWNNTWAEGDSSPHQATGKAHAEFRTTADYMRCRLRITRGEAQRRLKLASVLLPASGTSGELVPAARSEERRVGKECPV